MVPSSGVLSFFQLGPAICSVVAVFLWGAADFSGGYASRRANAFVFTAFSHLCAFALMLTVALSQHGVFPDRASIFWALAAGAIGGFSLAIFYRALAEGQMGLTAPIAALLGAAIPTMADIALEGAPSRRSIAGFALAIFAIWLITQTGISRGRANAGRPKGRCHRRSRWSRVCRILSLRPPGKRISRMDRRHFKGRVFHGNRDCGGRHGRTTRSGSSLHWPGRDRGVLRHHGQRIVHLCEPARPAR